MHRIGVLTSGGDAPGMNPAIRAVVRNALCLGMEVFGVRRGYRGMTENDMFQMNSRSVSRIINQGGTMLKSIRFPEFKDKKVRERAYKNLRGNRIEGLAIIGGDGSARAAHIFSTEFNFPLVLIPASIDNDLYGTDSTIGFDTAVNTAVDAIDRIRDTATSHERTFIVEVMGREKGNLAIEIGLACGAEIVLIPEIEINWDKIIEDLEYQKTQGKTSSIIVLAEGAGKGQEVAKRLQEKLPEKEIRVSVLGYIQRGGRPTSLTRNLATKFGVEAVNLLSRGKYGFMVGIKGREIVHVPLQEVVSNKKAPPLENLEIVKLMDT